MNCPQCRHENPPAQKFCGECGVRLSAVCGACGTSNAPTQKFCGECGARLPQAAPRTRFSSPDSYTPQYLAERILTSKHALEDERKHVTVLFADVKGSMELLADRDPEDARKLLDPVLELMIEAVHRYEGTVNQVMGDGIMALFGAPIAHEDHAVRACYAALRMQNAVQRYAEDVFRSHGVPVRIRVGLNSGEVVVRAVGSDLRMEYTAVGQTTHLAARMEQAAAPGAILITAETLDLAEGSIEVKALGPVLVRGLAEPVEVYEVTGARLARRRLEAAATRGFTRFIGRDTELDQLRRALERALHGHGQVTAVVGEPGVGKSRLIFEFIHSHRTQSWLCLEAGSVSYGKATSYLPTAELLKGYFHIAPRDDAREIREKVTGKLLTLDRALEPILTPLLVLLDVAADDPEWERLDPPQRRQRTLEAAKRLLLRESQVQPLLLVFEDLHWIDGETQAVLDSLVDSLPTARILLLVNYRPEYQHGWSSKSYYRQLPLEPLPPESAQAVLDALLGGDSDLRRLKELLIDRTEGNPFFLEESVRTLVETKALTGERGGYRLARSVETVQVPATVQAVLAARIDRLPPNEKRLLQSAAVIGHEVPLVLLEAIAEETAEQLRRDLAHLQAAEFLYETRMFPDLEYTFRHALTHEVAYGGLLQNRRRVLHARIVEAIERLYPDRIAEHLERLAHHALRGEMWDKAVRYLRESGAKAVARSANREAIQFFDQALQALRNLPETLQTLSEALDIRIVLGPALISVKGTPAPEVEASYRHAHDLCDRLGDTSRLFPVLWGLWFTTYGQGRHAARELAERLLAVAEDSQDSGQLVEAHHSMWATLMAMGETASMREYLERGLTLYDREQHGSQAFFYGGHDPGTCCRYHLGMARWLLGYPDQALEASRSALSLAAELSHAGTTVLTLLYASVLHYHRGEFRVAAEHAEVMLRLATEKGFLGYVGDAAVLLARALMEEGSVERLESAHETFAATRSGSARWRDTLAACLLADAHGRAGQPETGLEVLASLSEEQRRSFYAPELYRVEGELLLRRGMPRSHDEAGHCFRRALELADRRRERSLQLRAALSLARLLEGDGRRAEARPVLAEAYGYFTEGFDTADLRTARSVLDTLS
jgi:class 3 adenylate cyclase/tetratricopeptide (TPR) repeat protein